MSQNPVIQAIGTAVPQFKISQKLHYSILESANGMNREEGLALKVIYSRSGIEHRHSVIDEFAETDRAGHKLFHPSAEFSATPVSKRMEIYEEHAAALCGNAVRAALNKLPLFDKRSVTHLITFSCTGMFAPGLDIQLVEQLELNRSVERTCINFMGCYAAINALKSAYYISKSDPEAVVLIAGVELCSLHYQKSHETNQMVANALFSDGAAAAVISSKALNNTPDEMQFSLQAFYSEFEQSASNDMVWRIGDAGFDLRLSPEVPGVVRKSIGGLMDHLFERAGLSKEEIDHYAIHPGGVKILEACEEALMMSKDENEIAYDVLRNYGNMSSVTILFVLEAYAKKLAGMRKRENIAACAFGPGITMEAMILQTC